MFEKIEDIIRADTNDLKELAKIAGGNPKTFYVAIDLSDCNISRSDLAGYGTRGTTFAEDKEANHALRDIKISKQADLEGDIDTVTSLHHLAGTLQSQERLEEAEPKVERSKNGKKVLNAMTVDVEDYFQVSAFENYIARSDWGNLECRVEQNVDRILEKFSSKGIKATFFTLGWIAKRYPEMIRRIVREGHELASHGWEHIRVFNQTPQQFSADIVKSKHVLEDISGCAVLGYRVASYSINRTNLWAHDILREAGYTYSSSIAPINDFDYGIMDAPRFAHYRSGSEIVDGSDDAILEIPITTVAVSNKNLPCGGGGWFRLYPYNLSKWALEWVNFHDRQASVFYFHPWEIDPDQPRQTNLDSKTRFRHYQNLNRMEGKLDRLLSDFRWGRMIDVFDIQGREAYDDVSDSTEVN